jgi:hypothetical protein
VELLSVSIAEETDALARSLGKTRSELVRDALRRQLQVERLADLQRYGRGRVRRFSDAMAAIPPSSELFAAARATLGACIRVLREGTNMSQ